MNITSPELQTQDNLSNFGYPEFATQDIIIENYEVYSPNTHSKSS